MHSNIRIISSFALGTTLLCGSTNIVAGMETEKEQTNVTNSQELSYNEATPKMQTWYRAWETVLNNGEKTDEKNEKIVIENLGLVFQHLDLYRKYDGYLTTKKERIENMTWRDLADYLVFNGLGGQKFKQDILTTTPSFQESFFEELSKIISTPSSLQGDKQSIFVPYSKKCHEEDTFSKEYTGCKKILNTIYKNNSQDRIYGIIYSLEQIMKKFGIPN